MAAIAAGQGQAVTAKGKGQAANAVEAQSADQNDRRNQQVSGIGKVDLIFYYVAHAYRGNHAVQHKGNAADDCSGNGVDNFRKRGAERKDDRAVGRDAYHTGIIYPGQNQHAGILTISGVRRPPNSAASEVASPSPIRLRCRPGSSI